MYDWQILDIQYNTPPSKWTNEPNDEVGIDSTRAQNRCFVVVDRLWCDGATAGSTPMANVSNVM